MAMGKVQAISSQGISMSDCNIDARQLPKSEIDITTEKDSKE